MTSQLLERLQRWQTYITANGKYMTEFRIDGSAQTVKWAGGSAPSSGSASE